ncbi:MAG: hypothetical protein FD180_2885 [Planctomycetota bacterium]|nr:MAG: hypothetical protein FD180_2885 [Planctomycetota bacterium]
MNPSVLVAGPSPERRAEFIEALRDTPHRLAAETGRADLVLPLIDKHLPWCVALDLALAPSSLVQQILQKHPGITVLALHDAATAPGIPEARRAGVSEVLAMPVDAPKLLRVISSLSNPKGQSASRKFLAMRHQTTLAATYKAANDGFLTRRRAAIALELGLTDVVLQTEEAFAAGRELVATFQIPAQGALNAQLRVVRVEPAPVFGRFLITLAWHDMKEYDRERLKVFCRQLLAKVPSGVPVVAGMA